MNKLIREAENIYREYRFKTIDYFYAWRNIQDCIDRAVDKSTMRMIYKIRTQLESSYQFKLKYGLIDKLPTGVKKSV